WNSVTVDMSAFAGRTVETIVFTYDQPDAPAGTAVTGYLDDISIVPTTPLDTSEGLVSYVDTRRGTNSSGGFSRGNNFPAVAVPNGFNFITPMTDAATTGTLYAYHRDTTAEKQPTLQATSRLPRHPVRLPARQQCREPARPAGDRLLPRAQYLGGRPQPARRPPGRRNRTLLHPDRP